MKNKQTNTLNQKQLEEEKVYFVLYFLHSLPLWDVRVGTEAETVEELCVLAHGFLTGKEVWGAGGRETREYLNALCFLLLSS